MLLIRVAGYVNADLDAPSGISDVVAAAFGATIRAYTTTLDGIVTSFTLDGATLVADGTRQIPTAIDIGATHLLWLQGQQALATLGTTARSLTAIDLAPDGAFVDGIDAISPAADNHDLQAVVEIGTGSSARIASYDRLSGDIEVWTPGPDGFTRQSSNVTVNAAAMASYGTDTVYVADRESHGIRSFLVADDGRLIAAASIGPDEALPVANPTALAVIETAGGPFLVMGANGTNSLTTFRIGANGSLTPVDHVIDTRDTRFESATAIAGFEIAGRGYLVAAGLDDGVSIFTLLPDGRLVHMQTMIDALDRSIGDAIAIDVALTESGAAQIFVVGREGMAHLSFDGSGIDIIRAAGNGGETLTGGPDDDLLEGGAGDDTIEGGNGADVIRDGGGSDVLTSGAGPDIYVLDADGALDRITDFDVSDRLDLTAWTRLGGANQVDVQVLDWGSRLSFRDEVLDIVTTGFTLDAAYLASIGIGGIYRVDLDIEADEPLVADQGTPGDDTLNGTPLADTIDGGRGDDLIAGLAGDDTLRGDDGRDEMSGGEGDDLLHGGEGHDGIDGDDGLDTIFGEAGDDNLDGGAGADELIGGAGDDVLLGGDGNDLLIGDSTGGMLPGAYAELMLDWPI